MKCKLCGEVAQIELRNHNISLCKGHFLEFIEKRVTKTIEKYSLFNIIDKILVAVSGGKDSLALLHILKKMGFNVTGFYINLGIPVYSDASQEKCMIFSKKYDVPIYVFDLKSFFGIGVFEISKKIRRNSCSVCGIIKRYVMNRFGLEEGYTVLATGHNLDDEASFALGSVLNFDIQRLDKDRIILPSKDKALKKVKPLSFLTEKEVAGYTILNGIDYIYDECPYSKGATSMVYKRALNLIEERSPGTKLRFFKKIIENKELFKKSQENPLEEENQFCINCGYLTYREKCNFCLIAEKLLCDNKVRCNFFDNIFQL
ncbi:MAG: adenine nucleotide alpha hydrolase family protein [Proteobacteria bacterium]|nr:adenine nucleotide alpha hydrolase family protein [Pseudomonadota bacterium]